jgi:hypothetical protein
MSIGPIIIAIKLVLVNGFIPHQLIIKQIVLQLICIDCPPPILFWQCLVYSVRLVWELVHESFWKWNEMWQEERNIVCVREFRKVPRTTYKKSPPSHFHLVSQFSFFLVSWILSPANCHYIVLFYYWVMVGWWSFDHFEWFYFISMIDIIYQS